MGRLTILAALGSVAAMGLAPSSAFAQISAVSEADGVHAGELAVPVGKSQVIRSDRPFAKALIGNPDVADVLPLTDHSLYVLGKKAGTTSLTLYDRRSNLLAVMDVAVGPDVMGLKRQLSQLIPGEGVGARISNDSIVLEGIVPSGPAADRAVQLAETYAPGKVVNLLSVGSAQQIMLEVRFSEVKRSALKQLGVRYGVNGDKTEGVIGSGSSLTPGGVQTTTVTDPVTGTVTETTRAGPPVFGLGTILDSFGIISRTFKIFGSDTTAILDALERRGLVTTLAEPTLVALSGQTASFLAGGEFPVPVAQDVGGGTNSSSAITVEWKPFGVSLAFTPTVLADGVINLVVAPEVSSIDPSASIVINNLRIPGIQTRRAKTVVELRDGESFAMAGLLRRDFQTTIQQVPLLGSIPLIGALFRSSGFQRDETELVMTVTPRLVSPVRAAALKVPTDRVAPPNEADLFLLGRGDERIPASGPSLPYPPLSAAMPSSSAAGAASTMQVAPAPPGSSSELKPIGLEKDYGHVL